MSSPSFPDLPLELRHLIWMEAANGGTKRDQCQLIRVCKESMQSVYPIFLKTLVFDTSNSQTRNVASLEACLSTNTQLVGQRTSRLFLNLTRGGCQFRTLQSFSLSLRPSTFESVQYAWVYVASCHGQTLSFTLSLPDLTHLSLHPSFNDVKWKGFISSPSYPQAHDLTANCAFNNVTHLSLGVRWDHTRQTPSLDNVRLFRALSHLLYHNPDFPDLPALRDFCEGLPPTLHLFIFHTEQHLVSPIDNFLQGLPISKHRSVALNDSTEHLGYGHDSQFARWECQDALWEAGEKLLAERLKYENCPVSYISPLHTD
ncbi:hypothetical protein DL96DRAFT_311974 [Flagelloscypha sp. PMI_526]|nr:hypothetical protein DL96DRAFT_311974 [Flagelloscypha sp. PMI_526]